MLSAKLSFLLDAENTTGDSSTVAKRLTIGVIWYSRGAWEYIGDVSWGASEQGDWGILRADLDIYSVYMI